MRLRKVLLSLFLPIIATSCSSNNTVSSSELASSMRHVKINIEEDINIDGLLDEYRPNSLVSFYVNSINDEQLDINIYNDKNTKIVYEGNNPYSFTMPDSDITLNISHIYKNKNILNAFDDEIYFFGRHYQKDRGIFLSFSNSGFLLDVDVLSSDNSVVADMHGWSYDPVLGDVSDQYLQPYIDGERSEKIPVRNGDNHVVIASNLPLGKHILEFKKCNEAQFSSIILDKIFLDNVRVKKHTDQRKLIEIYGDSISCGYGILSKTNTEHFSLEKEDSTLSYSQLIADKIRYRNSTIAYSGIGLYKSLADSLPNILDFYQSIDSVSYAEQMKNDAPDIVLINLGSNDHAKYITLTEQNDIKDFEQGFKNSLKTMLNTILTIGLKTKIIFCYEMCYTLEPGLLEAVNDAINETKQIFNVSDIYTLKFTINNDGADGHPSKEAQSKAAEELYSFFIDNQLI